jgi:hypothetical protein
MHCSVDDCTTKINACTTELKTSKVVEGAQRKHGTMHGRTFYVVRAYVGPTGTHLPTLYQLRIWLRSKL